MFREGQYLEVIKASESCLATAIVTVMEKTVEIEKKKISTNKWLTLEDWSSLYRIIQKAILRNSEVGRGGVITKTSKRRKSTRRLDVIYNFEQKDDESSMPTIKVRVSPVKRRSKEEKSIEKEIVSTVTSNDSPEMQVKRLMEGVHSNPEEYVPKELPNRTIAEAGLNYIPSRKSFLKQMRYSSHSNSNEYTPISETQPSENGTAYVPNPISSLSKKRSHEIYEPPGLSADISVAYVPSSKGSCVRSNTVIEQYEPDFASTEIQFDVSYIPSSKKNRESKQIEPPKKKIHREQECKEPKRSSIKPGKRVSSRAA